MQMRACVNISICSYSIVRGECCVLRSCNLSNQTQVVVGIPYFGVELGSFLFLMATFGTNLMQTRKNT